MLRKILFACCLVGISVTFIAGCNDAAKKPADNKPAATDKKSDGKKDDKKADSKSGKRPASPPHAPGNS